MKLLKPLMTQSELHTVYTATIRSLMEYCCPAFVSLPRFLSERLEKIGKRAHRIIYGESASTACTCSHKDIERRRIIISRALLRSIEKKEDHLLRGILPERLPRSGHYSLPYCRTHKYQHSFMPFMSAIANSEVWWLPPCSYISCCTMFISYLLIFVTVSFFVKLYLKIPNDLYDFHL